MRTLAEAQKFWNDRYSSREYIYGKSPNAFFSRQLARLRPGRILLPAEGEGRNAVYAASRGWTVDAFDISSEAREKALKLAAEEGVTIHKYEVSAIEDLGPLKPVYDAIALIYVHFQADKRRPMHRKLIGGLKPGGKLILEAFAKEQLNNDSGGPKDESMLYSMEELAQDFHELNLLSVKPMTEMISEGKHHQGKANIIRIVAERTH